MMMEEYNAPHPAPSVFAEVNEVQRAIHERGVKKARNTLFAVGILLVAFDVIFMLFKNDLSSLALTIACCIDAAILGIFLGLGFWTKKKPYTAILLGLIAFVLLQATFAYLDPTMVYKGIIMKIGIIITLAKGLGDAKAIQAMQE